MAIAKEEELRLGIYGMMGEFTTPAELLNAVRRAKEEGYTRFEAYTPFPIEEVNEEVAGRRTRLPILIFLGGLAGCLTGYMLQYYVHALYYPLNVGGRPFNSWPNFIPVTFELTILFAAAAAVIGMLFANGLPRPYHPVFNIPRFDLASQERFYLVIEADDERFDLERTRQFFDQLPASRVTDVEF
jgi:Protein of unknown function (DUF3341)